MPTKDKDWQGRDDVLRGKSRKLHPAEEAFGPVVDQPTEDGGPVRGPEDEPFRRDPELVEADQTVYTGDADAKPAKG